MWQPDRGHQHPWVVTILGARPFYNSNIEFCSDKKSGNCDFVKMSVLVILEKSLVFLWYVLTWLCGVRRRQVCVVEAHESVGDGVVSTEEPQISVAVQNSSKLRRNVLMISPDGDGQWDSTSVNLISCSPEWMKVRKYNRPVRILHKGSKLGGQQRLL